MLLMIKWYTRKMNPQGNHKMDYVIHHNEIFSPMQSSSALARKAEQNYQEMIDAKLLHTLERMSAPNYQAKPMPDNFHNAVLQRVLARMDK